MYHGEFALTLLQLDVCSLSFAFIIHVQSTNRSPPVFPSAIAAPLFKKFVIDPQKAITEEGVFSRSYQPAERAGSIEDMAGLTLYMTSRAGAFVNGSVMLADGGKLATMPATY